MNLQSVHSFVFSLIAAVFFVAYSLNWVFDEGLVVQALALLVLLMGVPHGAIDPLLAREKGLWSSAKGLLLFSLLYLATAGVAAVLWILSPLLVLGIFMAISVWHFSGDWAQTVGRGLGLAVSASVLTLPALFHFQEVNEIFTVLTIRNPFVLTTAMLFIAPVVTLAAIFAAVKSMLISRLDGIEIVVLILSAVVIPPLWFFLLYFCFLHSPRHLMRAMMTYRRKALINTILAFSIATALLAAGALVVLPTPNFDDRLLQVVFVGLFALTIPHMILNEVMRTPKGAESETQ